MVLVAVGAAGAVGAVSAHFINTWNSRQGTFDTSVNLMAFVLVGGLTIFMIRRLREIHLREVWITYPGVEFVCEYICPLSSAEPRA